METVVCEKKSLFPQFILLTHYILFPFQNIVELLLSSANKLGGAAMVERLVGERDSEGETCLHLAVNNGHLEVNVECVWPQCSYCFGY